MLINVILCYILNMIELLILYVILKRDYTMYAIQKRIEDNFAPFAKPSFGALKPALRRLEEKECLTSRKMMSDGGKLSVYYEITKNGIRITRIIVNLFGMLFILLPPRYIFRQSDHIHWHR